nr:hypothetical protein [Mesorhizobium hawassense]
MRFEMGGIDHQIVRFAPLGGQFCQNAVEYTQSAPADEAVVDGLVRTVVGWGGMRQRSASRGMRCIDGPTGQGIRYRDGPAVSDSSECPSSIKQRR